MKYFVGILVQKTLADDGCQLFWGQCLYIAWEQMVRVGL